MDVDVGHVSRFYRIRPVGYHRGVIPAIVLAAGMSTRMGRTKALLPLSARDTFLTRVIRTLQAAGVEEVVVVVGHDWERVIESVTDRGLQPRFVVNTAYASGQLSSVMAGLRAVDRPEVAAALLTLVDVPLVSVETVQAVVRRYRETGAAIVRPTRGAEHGHPVLVDRALFAALRAADPARGIKPVIRAHATALGSVDVADDAAYLDIDTPEEYARVRAVPALGTMPGEP
jgi:CTP:molybdopterin cytidylyltransferase MocA